MESKDWIIFSLIIILIVLAFGGFNSRTGFSGYGCSMLSGGFGGFGFGMMLFWIILFFVLIYFIFWIINKSKNLEKNEKKGVRRK